MASVIESLISMPTRRRGRPSKPGSKRSNPDYRPWSGLLRGQYIREADIVLKQTEDPRDMSDLITELLGNWVSEHTLTHKGALKEGIAVSQLASEQEAIEQ